MAATASTSLPYDKVLTHQSQQWKKSAVQFLGVLLVIGISAYYVGLFDGARLAEGIPSIKSLFAEMFPPNFTDAKSWIKP